MPQKPSSKPVKSTTKPQQKRKQIDISSQPYDKHLQVLKNWRFQGRQQILQTLDLLLKYKYKCLSQLQMIKQNILVFQKKLWKQKQITSPTEQKIQIDQQYFQKLIQLKNLFKQLQKKGCFQGQNKIKQKILQYQNNKKNLKNINVMTPPQLLQKQREQFHQNNLSNIYKAFITYYPQSHQQQQLNQKLILFLQQLYFHLKKKYFYLRQKEYFLFEIDKLCNKLNKQKFKENKVKMMDGSITVMDVVMNRQNAFENYYAKRKEEEFNKKLLRECEVGENRRREEEGEEAEEEQQENGKETENQEEYKEKKQENGKIKQTDNTGNKKQENFKIAKNDSQNKTKQLEDSIQLIIVKSEPKIKHNPES